jgi:hypothetical protein
MRHLGMLKGQKSSKTVAELDDTLDVIQF